MPQTILSVTTAQRTSSQASPHYRHTSGTPRNLISFLEIRPGSTEESAMHIAVSKAITKEQEFSLPTSHSCFPSANGCYFSLTGARCPDQTHCGSEEKHKEGGGKKQIIGKKRREIVFAKCQEVNVYDAASSYLMSELKEFVLPHVNLYICTSTSE